MLPIKEDTVYRSSIRSPRKTVALGTKSESATANACVRLMGSRPCVVQQNCAGRLLKVAQSMSLDCKGSVAAWCVVRQLRRTVLETPDISNAKARRSTRKRAPFAPVQWRLLNTLQGMNANVTYRSNWLRPVVYCEIRFSPM